MADLLDGRVLEAIQDDAQHISMRIKLDSDNLDPFKNLAKFSPKCGYGYNLTAYSSNCYPSLAICNLLWP